MADRASTRAKARLVRGPSACQRCRRRKQKCDMKSPRCSNCQVAEAQCLMFNTAKQAEVPRDYVLILESQIAQLQRENEELRTRTPTDASPTDVSQVCEDIYVMPTPTAQDWVSSSLGRIVSEPSNQSPFYGMSSGITLARLVMAAIHVPGPAVSSPDRFGHQASILSSSQPTIQATLPPRHAAEHLVEVYFQFQTPHAPIIERAKVDQTIQDAYQLHSHLSNEQKTSQDLFVIYMIFAIALCSVSHPSGDRPPQSVECFNSAISHLEAVLIYSRSQLEALRALLLLCQYVALCPAKGSLWLLTGTALRLAIDLGLHWEAEQTDTSFQELNDRRCLWWSAYQFDRMLCITIGRPFGIQEPGINVALPDLRPFQTNQGPHRHTITARKAHNSLILMARLESEIKHVLYGHLLQASAAYPKADYRVWLPDITARLHEWHDTIPCVEDAVPMSIFACQAYWDAMYNNALLFLHRPNPLAPQPTSESMHIYLKAACNAIKSIKALHRLRKIDIMWKWTHHLFMAGLALLYCVWHSQGLRAHLDLKTCIPTIQTCASTLAALSERWNGAVGCRDAFEALSTITIDWLITSSAERASWTQFEQQLQELQHQISPMLPGMAGTSDAFAMLSTDGYGFGEYLNSFAQWPQVENADIWS